MNMRCVLIVLMVFGVVMMCESHKVMVPRQRCIVVSTLHDAVCGHVFNASQMVKDPQFIDDGVIYYDLQEALDNCPFNPVVLEIHGIVVAPPNLSFTQKKNLLIRGIDDQVSMILHFSDFLLDNDDKEVVFENMVLDGCNTTKGMLTNDRVNYCVSTAVIGFDNTVAQKYNSSVAICQNRTGFSSSECNNALIVHNSKFFDFAGIIVSTLEVEQVSIMNSVFCPCVSPYCVNTGSFDKEPVFELAGNTFCTDHHQNINLQI